MRPAVPADFRLLIDPATRVLDGGATLIGGAPLRILRLNAAGVAAWQAISTGGPVGDDRAPDERAPDERAPDERAPDDRAPSRAPNERARNALARRLLDGGLAHPVPPPAGHEAIDHEAFDVVIPVKDDPRGLARTLATLDRTPIVVDDGSAAPLLHATSRHETPRGPAAARNAGFERTTTGIVAFVDAGCELPPGCLDALAAHFADPAVGAVAPRITPSQATPYEQHRSPLDLGVRPANVRPRSAVPYVPATTLLVRRTALMALTATTATTAPTAPTATTPFDENLRFGEDVDLIWRLVDAGWTVRYDPTQEVTHPARPTRRQRLRQRFDYGTSAAPLATRHGKKVAPLAISPWSAAVWCLLAAGAPGLAAATAAGTALALTRKLPIPARESARLALAGHLHAGRYLADAIRRAWWPAAAIVSPSATAAAVLIPPLLDRPPGYNPVTWLGDYLADDLAYATGVWAGCIKARSTTALRPDLRNWPQSSSLPTTDTKDTISPG
jgi:mycofactocin system glycosyltransferase